MLPMTPSCLSATLDALDETQFWGGSLDKDEQTAVAHWIAAQRDVLRLAPGVWRTEAGSGQLSVFTGERIHTRLATGNILGVDACRALVHLAPDDNVIAPVLNDAQSCIGHSCFANGCVKGECAHSAVAYWRYLAAAGGEAAEGRLHGAAELLSAHRDGKGRWYGFPYYYTPVDAGGIRQLSRPAGRA